MEYLFLCIVILLVFAILYPALKAIRYVFDCFLHVFGIGESKIEPKIKFILSDKDSKIRKDWHKSLIVFYVGLLAVSFFVYGIRIRNQASEIEFLNQVSYWAITTAVYLGLMYFFAYVQFGTRWIGWFVIVSPIWKILDVIENTLEINRNTNIDNLQTISWLLIEIVSTAIYMCFWTHSKRLYDLNFSLQKKLLRGNSQELKFKN